MTANAILFASMILGQAPQPPNGGQPDVRCGSYCLYVALQAFGMNPDTFPELEQVLGPPGPGGYSMLQLQKTAEKYGAKTLAVETSIENLIDRKGRFACLTLIDDTHYVLLYDAVAPQVSVIDPPKQYSMNRDLFLTRWSRKALLVGIGDFSSEESIESARFFRKSLRWGFAAVCVALPLLAFIVFRSRRARLQRSTALVSVAIILSTANGCRPSDPGTSPGKVEAPVRDIIPWLTVDSETVNLGTIVRKVGPQEVPFQIEVRNQGFKTVTIEGIETSCGCTGAKLGVKFLKPRESSRLVGTVRIGDSSATNSARITITSDDPVTPKLTLTVNWEVKNALRTSPATLTVSTLSPNEAAPTQDLPILLEGLNLCDRCELSLNSGSIALVSETTLDFHRSPSHEAVDRFLAAREIGRLQISIVGQADERHYTDSATIAMSCRGQTLASFTLPVSWTVAAPVHASPSRLFAGKSPPAAHITQKIVLQSRDGLPFRVVSITGTPAERQIKAIIPAASDIFHHLDFDLISPSDEGP